MSAPIRTNDIDLRLVVTRALLAAGHPREAIRHEITLDSSSSDGRADMVLALDRALIGIELKSGKDTLDRLESQRERYGRRFDRLCLVIDARHEPGPLDYAAHNALRFGTVRVFDSGSLRRGRCMGGIHPAPWELDERRWSDASPGLSPFAMLSMLWQIETERAAHDLFKHGLIPVGPVGTRCRAIPHMAEHASIAALRPRIAAALRSRPLNRWEEAFWKRFDAESRTGAASVSPSTYMDWRGQCIGSSADLAAELRRIEGGGESDSDAFLSAISDVFGGPDETSSLIQDLERGTGDRAETVGFVLAWAVGAGLAQSNHIAAPAAEKE